MKIGSEQAQQLSESLLRFQQARATALQKMQSPDPRGKLENLIKANKRGQGPLPTRQNTPSAGEPIIGPAFTKGVSKMVQQTFIKANELLMYSQDSRSSAPKSNTRILGNYVDMVA